MHICELHKITKQKVFSCFVLFVCLFVGFFFGFFVCFFCAFLSYISGVRYFWVRFLRM